MKTLGIPVIWSMDSPLVAQVGAQQCYHRWSLLDLNGPWEAEEPTMDRPLTLSVFACRVFMRDLSYLAAQSNNIIDLNWIPQGLHETPEVLNSFLQTAIDTMYDQVDSQIIKRHPDYICLGYGRCSKGVEGIVARDIPIVVPRTDDCIGIFLGSQKRYLDYFDRYKGTFWFNNGFIENWPILDDDYRDRRYREYLEKYGDEDLAADLADIFDEMVSGYSRLGYINSSVYDAPDYHERAMEFARKHDWEYFEVGDDNRILRNLVEGDWNDEDFLVCPPGYRIVPSNDEKRLKAEKV